MRKSRYLLLLTLFITLFFSKTFSEEKVVSCELMGGLGNQLFQVATTIASGKNQGYRAVFPRIEASPSYLKPRPVYWDNIFHKLETCKENKLKKFMLYREKEERRYRPLNFSHSYVKLAGYWQTEKYFSHYREYLINLFQLPDSIQKYVDQKFSSLTFEHKGPIVSVHLRLGDYLTLTDFMLLWKDEYKHYYIKAVESFPEDTLFMVFSDDPDFAMKFFQDNFSSRKVVFPVDRDFIELFLMSKCDHQIIANSTFSWWGAWLNQNPEKIVIAPLEWTITKGKPVFCYDYLPDSWHKISVVDGSFR